jgi:GNAT superfamily N-acetyltransferase
MVVLVALALAHQTKYIWIAGLVAGSWAGYMRFRVVNTMVNYVNRETHENLADIEATYFKREGTFLVAIDNSSGRIVGMVGGDNKGKGVLELRRMSVDLSIHSKGLGTRIVHELENFARKNGFKKILLYCTTGQYAANRLYQKTGFELLDLIPMSELPGTHMCHYEKNLMK